MCKFICCPDPAIIDLYLEPHPTLPTRTLGRTGLQVSVLGLGCGGNSRLGLSSGLGEAHAADVVRAALDLGLTLVDTARVYQTERPVGVALQGRRAGIVLSSKSPYLDRAGELLSAQEFARNIDASLRDLATDWIDIYFIHGLRLEYYEIARQRFLPVLQAARQAGKIRYFGLSEAFESDTTHAMLQSAVHDPEWDVLMVGYNLLNQSARHKVFAYTQPARIATLGMFAVRRALINPDLLRTLLRRLAELGQVSPELAEAPDLLEALGLRGVCDSLSEAAYRFCAYQPGLDCVLVGTSNPAHLRANLAAVLRGPLPAPVIQHLQQLFAQVDSVSGQIRLIISP